MYLTTMKCSGLMEPFGILLHSSIFHSIRFCYSSNWRVLSNNLLRITNLDVLNNDEDNVFLKHFSKNFKG